LTELSALRTGSAGTTVTSSSTLSVNGTQGTYQQTRNSGGSYGVVEYYVLYIPNGNKVYIVNGKVNANLRLTFEAIAQSMTFR
jgi:hypothetical protein